MDPDARLVGWQQHDAHVHVDGEGQHEAAVVVGVLADEVDTPRRAHDHVLGLAAGCRGEDGGESAGQVGARKGVRFGHALDGRRRLVLSHGLLVGWATL